MWSDLLAQTDHRPYPPPERPWALHMRWSDLLFAHWPVEPALLRSLLPAGIELDIYDGQAWIGIVPFQMSHAGPRGVPTLGPLSRFPELNVRTYVTLDGIPGVWFFSLDAPNPLIVAGARMVFHLPYVRAKMRIDRPGEDIVYTSARADRRFPHAEFQATYWPTGPVSYAEPDSLDAWFTERYCLYAADKEGELFRCHIHHPPWPLQPAAAEFSVNTMAAAAGIPLPDFAPRLHLARQQDVIGWLPERTA